MAAKTKLISTNTLGNMFINSCVRAMDVKGIDRSMLAQKSGVSYSRVCGMLRGSDQGTLAAWTAIFAVLEIKAKLAGPELAVDVSGVCAANMAKKAIGWENSEEPCPSQGGSCHCTRFKGHRGPHRCQHGTWRESGVLDTHTPTVIAAVNTLTEIERRLSNLENHTHSGQSWVTTTKPQPGGSNGC